MRNPYPSRSILIVFVVLVLTIACGPTAEEAQEISFNESWAEVQQAKADLDASRAELTAVIETTSAEEGAGEDTEGDAPATPLTVLREKVDGEIREFADLLVNFINSLGIVEDEPLTEIQQAAIRLKSSEDMLVAAQYIGERVNYNRAIEIYNDSLRLDPDNDDLKAALAQAESMRFMTRERFANAREGMTEDEIAAAIGEVKSGNINDYADEGKDVVAWFYPREGGGSAAVWFRPDGGVLRVQLLKFDQVEPKSTN